MKILVLKIFLISFFANARHLTIYGELHSDSNEACVKQRELLSRKANNGLELLFSENIFLKHQFTDNHLDYLKAKSSEGIYGLEWKEANHIANLLVTIDEIKNVANKDSFSEADFLGEAFKSLHFLSNIYVDIKPKDFLKIINNLKFDPGHIRYVDEELKRKYALEMVQVYELIRNDIYRRIDNISKKLKVAPYSKLKYELKYSREFYNNNPNIFPLNNQLETLVVIWRNHLMLKNFEILMNSINSKKDVNVLLGVVHVDHFYNLLKNKFPNITKQFDKISLNYFCSDK